MNRTEWILGGLLAILLIVVTAIALLTWRQNRSLDTPVAADNVQRHNQRSDSARGAYTQAKGVAQDWAEDAQLLDGTAIWPPGVQFGPLDASWSFVFFSPQKQQVALVTVADNQARLFRSRPAETAYRPARTADWLLDSPDIITAVMAHGGHDFIQQHGSATLALKIDLNDTPIWQSGLTARETGSRLNLLFDAGTGQLLHQEETP
jgi:hypothetical protein